jgi:phosphoribosylamine--glycine ligase
MNIIIVGSGGREHALKWKLEQDGHSATLIAPNSPDISQLFPRSRLAEGFAGSGIGTILNSQLVIIGPEAPLAEGIVDALSAQGVRVFGPTRAAAQLESSKAFSKRFMRRHAIPTANFEVFTQFDDAIAFVRSAPFARAGFVVKASGLAAGKGVIVCDDAIEAEQALSRVMRDREFGSAGNEVIIEEKLNGPEVSLMAFCDGATVKAMLPAQDHKRVFDGDKGPNTGGMGAFCPSPLMTHDNIQRCIDAVLLPAVRGMAEEGAPYKGVLYAGLMLTPQGPMVLEFNCRFGDPETQVVMPLLKTDLAEIANACIDGRLHAIDIEWHAGAAACIVLTSGGYPGAFKRGLPIHGLSDLPEGVMAFSAGVKREGEHLFTDGGRVLGITARGDDLRDALQKAYAGVACVSFEGMHCRRDIGRLG